MNRLSRILGWFRRPAHMTWGGDLKDGFTPIWEPDGRGDVR